jgi:hypothetical protein
MARVTTRANVTCGDDWNSVEYVSLNMNRLGRTGRHFPALDFIVNGSHRLAPSASANKIGTRDSGAVVSKIGSDELLTRSRRLFLKKGSEYVKRPTNRPTFFSEIRPSKGLGLEIGPLHAPICPRPAFNIRYIDAFSTEQLKRQHAENPDVPIEKIVDVDYVWSGEPYGQLINERFDFVVSSHNIEHVPCLISFLRSIESCMKFNAELYLAIPDKRYCFDYFKSESTIDDVLDSLASNRKKPTPRQLIRHELLRTHNDSIRHWLADHGTPEFVNTSDCGQRSLELLRSFGSDNAYHDTHCWIFTPGTFAEIMEFLHDQKLVQLKLTSLFPTEPNSHEFYAVLTLPHI